MRQYSDKISLIKNSRGVYCIDPSIGCAPGLADDSRGCYNDCYAAKSAKIYGYDFGKTTLRYFKNSKHKKEILSKIRNAKLDFIRMGCSGDPSENWSHTLDIISQIAHCGKEIVIITRHWRVLTNEQLIELSKYRVCINTSVSALDTDFIRLKCVEQYTRIKPYCKSILRIVSCDFNLLNEKGHRLYIVQNDLFKNESIIDTVFRPTKNNSLVTDGIINTKHGVFCGSKQLMSKYNPKTYIGKCDKCLEMCGAKMTPKSHEIKSSIQLTKQLSII